MIQNITTILSTKLNIISSRIEILSLRWSNEILKFIVSFSVLPINNNSNTNRMLRSLDESSSNSDVNDIASQLDLLLSDPNSGLSLDENEGSIGVNPSTDISSSSTTIVIQEGADSETVNQLSNDVKNISDTVSIKFQNLSDSVNTKFEENENKISAKFEENENKISAKFEENAKMVQNISDIVLESSNTTKVLQAQILDL